MKVLEICAKLNIGGAQAVAANIARYADESFKFTYAVFGEEVGEYEAEVKRKGNEILHIPAPPNGQLRFLANLLRIMRRGKFDAVHCHTMYSCGTVMLAAKLCGIPRRVSHSHTAKDEAKQSFSRKAYKRFMRFLMKTCGNVFLACGVDAGNELYGEDWFSAHGEVIKNGIDISRYVYSSDSAEAIRKKYNISDAFVVGHVGHYVNVKNQAFLIEMMLEIRKRKPKAVLLMFGEGADRGRLEALIREKHAEDYARLMGNVNNINEVLSSFDVFAFPSLYEGTPLSLIEAQANGVPCIISDTIPGDACLTDLIIKLPLSDTKSWVEAILTAKRDNSKEYNSAVREQYEDVKSSMERLYEVLAENKR